MKFFNPLSTLTNYFSSTDTDEKDITKESNEAESETTGIFSAIVIKLENRIIEWQRLLLWKDSIKSLKLLVFANSLLFFMTALKIPLFPYLLYLLICYVLVELWLGIIWPEIKIPDESDDVEPWVHLEPDALCAQEIITYSTNFLESIPSHISKSYEYCINYPVKVSILSALSLVCLIQYQQHLIYLFVTGILTIPGIIHNLGQDSKDWSFFMDPRDENKYVKDLTFDVDEADMSFLKEVSQGNIISTSNRNDDSDNSESLFYPTIDSPPTIKDSDSDLEDLDLDWK